MVCNIRLRASKATTTDRTAAPLVRSGLFCFELSSWPQNKVHFPEKVVLGGAEAKKDNKNEIPFNLKYALERITKE